MSGQDIYEPYASELDALQTELKSIPGAAPSLDEIMDAWESGSEIRLRRRDTQLTPEQLKHERNVGCFQETALTYHFQRMLSTHREKETWAVGVAFFAAHMNGTPSQILKDIKPLLINLRPRKTLPDNHIPILLIFWIIIKFMNPSLLVSWIIMYILLLMIFLYNTRYMHCRRLYRSLPDQEALEAYCDVLAGNCLRRFPWPFWVLVASVIVISLYFIAT